MSNVVIKINDVDKTEFVSWESLKINSILTNQVDSCNFTIQSYEGKSLSPEVEDDVKIYSDDTLIFGGNIKRIVEKIRTDELVLRDVECADYTRQMDKISVAFIYENETVNDIIADLKDKYFPDFTVNNVSCTVEIPYIMFNYENPSKCLGKLADLTGYDWYVDYEKDIHFFRRGSNPAPFNLTDESDNFIFNSLEFIEDSSQLKNAVYIRGAEFVAESYPQSIVSTGTPLVYQLGYKYSNLVVDIAGSPISVGIDNIDEEDDYPCFHNFQEKIIRFKDGTKPAEGELIGINGSPYVPITVFRTDNASIGDYGEFNYYEYNKDLQDKVSAEKFGDAILDTYKDPVKRGKFLTYDDGLKAGQDITIQSTIRGIDESVLIDRVTTRLTTPFNLVYEVSFVSTKEYGIVELLASLFLKRETAEYRTDETVYKVWIFDTEQMTLSDSTPVFKDEETGPWYVKNGNTPVGICGFCQCS
jgi:hypothetical protein